MTDIIFIFLSVGIIVFTAGALLNLTYMTSFGTPVRHTFTKKKHYLRFGATGALLLLVFTVMSLKLSLGNSLLESFLIRLPNICVAITMIMIAYVIGFLLTLGVRKILSKKNSFSFHLLVAIIATIPLLLFMKSIIKTLIL